jgi:hypothetical protein|uniref:Uncharacterized protein n=1 Tax=Picea glauca TaxID=3330 RepID=A0A101LUK3_PICGL|nr:hypothetical protein ABT39_MTgene2465 [Picea glauca]
MGRTIKRYVVILTRYAFFFWGEPEAASSVPSNHVLKLGMQGERKGHSRAISRRTALVPVNVGETLVILPVQVAALASTI